MVPQLARAVDYYGLAVVSSGGFESVTEKHAFAETFADETRTTEVLHIGDHDPSGAHLFYALAEDVAAFAEHYGVAVTFSRLAVTPEQITDFSLPTAPPELTDRRAFKGETCQAEPIPPDVLVRILRDAVVTELVEKHRKDLEKERLRANKRKA